MISGEKWMLMWRSGLLGSSIGRSMTSCGSIVVAVGRLRPPYADDVRHYQKLLAGHTRLEQIEVREDEQVAPRLPDRAFVSLLHQDGRADGLGRVQPLARGAPPSGRDLCFVIGGPFGMATTSTPSTTACRSGR